MKSSKLFLAIAFFSTVGAHAASIDMDDPKRSVGREDDIRIDATLLDDTISSGTTIGVTYQIQNLTKHPIAIAEKVCSASYDADSRTITVSIGSEVPAHGLLPKMITIEPGQKKTVNTGAMFNIIVPSVRSPLSPAPRLLQIKVSVLRDVAPFQALIAQQVENAKPVELSDELFDKWLEGNDSIFLNAVPIHFDPTKGRRADAERHSMFGGQ
jgi:hypothetical protein